MWPLDGKLVERQEVVVLRILVVDELDRLVFLPVTAVLCNGGVPDEQLVLVPATCWISRTTLLRVFSLVYGVIRWT